MYVLVVYRVLHIVSPIYILKWGSGAGGPEESIIRD